MAAVLEGYNESRPTTSNTRETHRPPSLQVPVQHPPDGYSEPSSATSSTSAILTDFTTDWSIYEIAPSHYSDEEGRVHLFSVHSQSDRVTSWHTAPSHSRTSSPSSFDDTTLTMKPEAGSLPVTQSVCVPTREATQDTQQDTTEDFSKLAKDTINTMTEHLQLAKMSEILFTPIYPIANRSARFAPDNLQEYNADVVQVKIDELLRLNDIIAEGVKRYNVLRTLLSSTLWNETTAISYFRKKHNEIACNKEREKADFVLASLPFKEPFTHNSKRIARIASAVPKLHRQWAEHAKRWRGHVAIHLQHLEIHMKVFGVANLPELPKEVMRTCKELGHKRQPEVVAPPNVTPEGAGDSDNDTLVEVQRQRSEPRLHSLVGKKKKMVKSESNKAFRVLGFPDPLDLRT